MPISNYIPTGPGGARPAGSGLTGAVPQNQQFNLGFGVPSFNLGGLNIPIGQGLGGLYSMLGNIGASQNQGMAQYLAAALAAEANRYGTDAQRDIGMGNIDIQRQLGLGGIDLQRELGLGNIALQRELGLGGFDTQRDVANIGAGAQRDVAGIQAGASNYAADQALQAALRQALAGENIAGINVGGQLGVADIGAGAQRDVAQTQAGASMYGSDAALYAALAQALANQNIAQTQAGASMYGTDATRDIGLGQVGASLYGSDVARDVGLAQAGASRYGSDATRDVGLAGAAANRFGSLADLQGTLAQAGAQRYGFDVGRDIAGINIQPQLLAEQNRQGRFETITGALNPLLSVLGGAIGKSFGVPFQSAAPQMAQRPPSIPQFAMQSPVQPQMNTLQPFQPQPLGPPPETLRSPDQQPPDWYVRPPKRKYIA